MEIDSLEGMILKSNIPKKSSFIATCSVLLNYVFKMICYVFLNFRNQLTNRTL